MGKIQNIINKLKRDGSVEAQEKALLLIIRANEADALNLNRSQLLNNRDSDGESLGEYASIAYANKKGSHLVDLFLTGSFQDKLLLEADKFPARFDSSDKKTEQLTERYGESIFGLDEKSKGAFVGEIKPQVQDFYRSLIHV